MTQTQLDPAPLSKLRVGTISSQERDEIQALLDHKKALLVRSAHADLLELHSPEFEQLVTELGTVCIKINAWWAQKSTKYNWGYKFSDRYEIDFQDCSVFIVSRT